MHIRNLFDVLQQKTSTHLTPEIANNIKELKKICDEEFYNQNFYGGAALNRKILLDSRIADYLTQDVTLYLFTNSPTDETKIIRNSTGYTTLRDAIYYGMLEGLHVIKFLPNNEKGYGPVNYAEQVKSFNNNTLRIVENLKKASSMNDILLENDIYQISLVDQFEHIVRTIQLLKLQNKSEELLYVPNYSAIDLRKQVDMGFDWLCRHLIIADLSNETIDSFCEKFLQDPKAILHGEVIHLFYDRVHIEAALEQDTIIIIGDKSYTYLDIFRQLINKIATQPNQYPDCAKEQFYLRLSLVENHLMAKFKNAYDDSALAMVRDFPFPEKIEEVEIAEDKKLIGETTIFPVADTLHTTTTQMGLFAKSKQVEDNFITDSVKLYCTKKQEIALEFSNAEKAIQFASYFKNIIFSINEVDNNPNKVQFKSNKLHKVVKCFKEKPNHVFFMTLLTGNVRLAINFKTKEKRDKFIELLGIGMSEKVNHHNGLVSLTTIDGMFTIYDGQSVTGVIPNTSIYFSPGLFLNESANDFFTIANGNVTKAIYWEELKIKM